MAKTQGGLNAQLRALEIIRRKLKGHSSFLKKKVVFKRFKLAAVRKSVSE